MIRKVANGLIALKSDKEILSIFDEFVYLGRSELRSTYGYFKLCLLSPYDFLLRARMDHTIEYIIGILKCWR